MSSAKTQPFATNTEFARVFCEHMISLYLLAILLTANQAKAEECFVSGIEDCVNGAKELLQAYINGSVQQAAALFAEKGALE
jgi:hypothetical protein